MSERERELPSTTGESGCKGAVYYAETNACEVCMAAGTERKMGENERKQAFTLLSWPVMAETSEQSTALPPLLHSRSQCKARDRQRETLGKRLSIDL